MENCIHDIGLQTINGRLVSYCRKCGKILDSATSTPLTTGVSATWTNADTLDETPQNFGGLPSNGGQIMYD